MKQNILKKHKVQNVFYCFFNYAKTMGYTKGLTMGALTIYTLYSALGTVLISIEISGHSPFKPMDWIIYTSVLLGLAFLFVLITVSYNMWRKKGWWTKAYELSQEGGIEDIDTIIPDSTNGYGNNTAEYTYTAMGFTNDPKRPWENPETMKPPNSQLHKKKYWSKHGPGYKKLWRISFLIMVMSVPAIIAFHRADVGGVQGNYLHHRWDPQKAISADNDNPDCLGAGAMLPQCVGLFTSTADFMQWNVVVKVYWLALLLTTLMVMLTAGSVMYLLGGWEKIGHDLGMPISKYNSTNNRYEKQFDAAMF